MKVRPKTLKRMKTWIIMVVILQGLALTLSGCSFLSWFDDAAGTAVATQSLADGIQTYAIVDTGQDLTYDSANSLVAAPTAGQPFFGQDAQYDGNQPRYVDNGDGTVTDLVTGLMWQQAYSGKMTYAEAVAAAESFELAGYTDWRLPTIKELYSLIDFSGLDVSTNASVGAEPFIDTAYFDFAYGDTSAGERIIDSQWVTSTTYVAGNLMFGVNFADGRIKGYGYGEAGGGPLGTLSIDVARPGGQRPPGPGQPPSGGEEPVGQQTPPSEGQTPPAGGQTPPGEQTPPDSQTPPDNGQEPAGPSDSGVSSPNGEKTFLVRFVRGNTGYGENDFVNNGDGTISDRATDLMWARDDSGSITSSGGTAIASNGGAMDWEEALAYAEELNAQSYLGYSDWRLPNAKELQSIVDYSRSPDTTRTCSTLPSRPMAAFLRPLAAGRAARPTRTRASSSGMLRWVRSLSACQRSTSATTTRSSSRRMGHA